MDVGFIAISDALFNQSGDDEGLGRKLAKLGMSLCHSIGGFQVYAHAGLSLVRLANGGLVLGELYSNGVSISQQIGAISPTTGQSEARTFLLRHCWGQYVLLQPGPSREGMTVMRDPSGGLGCAYTAQGFVSSDLSIASVLGLYRKQIDWDFIEHCLRYPHMKIGRTALRGIRELLPGTLVAMTPSAMEESVAWSPWDFVATQQRMKSAPAAASSLRETIGTVVQDMAVHDQEVLLELSGGLDSSIVGACLAEADIRVACCNVITPLPGTDERQYAGAVAKKIKAPLLEKMLELEEPAISFPLTGPALRPAVWALSHCVAQVMDRAAEEVGANSLFSGGGGDTVFGYLKTAAPAADAFLERGFRDGTRAVVALSRLHQCTVAKAGRLTLKKLVRSPRPLLRPVTDLMAQAEPAPPLEHHPWLSAPTKALPGDRERIFEFAGAQLFRDSTPRASGHRVRMPLLSQPVMEACLRIPSWMWIADGRNRAVARDAFVDRLPSLVLNRRSKATFMNYTFALYRRHGPTIGRFLLEGELAGRGLLDTQALRASLGEPNTTRDRSFMRVFDLCMIENWIRHHA